MSGFPIVPMNAANVATFSDANLATLTAAVNTFLHAGQSAWRVTAIQYYYDGSDHIAVVTYTGS